MVILSAPSLRQEALKPVDLVLADLDIGHISGLEALDVVRARHPDMPGIVITGTGTEEPALQARKRLQRRFAGNSRQSLL